MTDVAQLSNQALDALGDTWKGMIEIIEAISAASGALSTDEPDLTHIQELRKVYHNRLSQLKTLATTLDDHANDQDSVMNLNDATKQDELLQERARLEEEHTRVSDKLEQLLKNSYALLFQIDMLMSCSDDTPKEE